MPLGQKRIIAAEIRRLAHFADGVGPGLAGFVHGNCHQHIAAMLQRVRHGAQDLGAARTAQRIPGGLRALAAAKALAISAGVASCDGAACVGFDVRQLLARRPRR